MIMFFLFNSYFFSLLLYFSQVEERFVAFGAGLTNVGIPMGQSSCIALYALNCAEVLEIIM